MQDRAHRTSRRNRTCSPAKRRCRRRVPSGTGHVAVLYRARGAAWRRSAGGGLAGSGLPGPGTVRLWRGAVGLREARYGGAAPTLLGLRLLGGALPGRGGDLLGAPQPLRPDRRLGRGVWRGHRHVAVGAVRHRAVPGVAVGLGGGRRPGCRTTAVHVLGDRSAPCMICCTKAQLSIRCLASSAPISPLASASSAAIGDGGHMALVGVQVEGQPLDADHAVSVEAGVQVTGSPRSCIAGPISAPPRAMTMRMTVQHFLAEDDGRHGLVPHRRRCRPVP